MGIWKLDQIALGVMAVADHVVRNARVRARGRVVDVACGTGNTALAARARGAEVTGLDLTPELLAVARECEAAEGLSGLDWRRGTPKTCRSRTRPELGLVGVEDVQHPWVFYRRELEAQPLIVARPIPTVPVK